VIIVNLCEHESFEVFHMKIAPKQKELSKRLYLSKVGENPQVIRVKNVYPSKKHDVWIKGDSWRRVPQKGHYFAFNLKKDGDYIIFVKDSKKCTYGGELDYNVEPLEMNKEELKELFENLTYVHWKLIPAVKKLTSLGALLSASKLRDCQDFKSKLEALGDDFRGHYAYYETEITRILKRFSYIDKPDSSSSEASIEDMLNNQENAFFEMISENAKLRKSSDEVSSLFENSEEDDHQGDHITTKRSVGVSTDQPEQKAVIHKEEKKSLAIPIDKFISGEIIFNLGEFSKRYTRDEMQKAITQLSAKILAAQTIISTTKKEEIRKKKQEEETHLETLKKSFAFGLMSKKI